jgi:hypothetical protein
MHVTVTEVMLGWETTVTVSLPDFVESSVDVAVIVAVPAAVGVKTPALLTAPMLVGLTDHVTDVLKLPVPATVGVQADVCVVRMDVGEQTTETEVIVGGTVTVTVADPDLVESCVDVAVTVAVPAPVGVKTPALLTEPTVVGLTDHVTPEL